MSKKYEKCSDRITLEGKQKNQRDLDKIFKQINGYVNPPRKAEEDRATITINYLENRRVHATNDVVRYSQLYKRITNDKQSKR